MIDTSKREVWLSSMQNIKMQDKWDLLVLEAASDQLRTLRGMD